MDELIPIHEMIPILYQWQLAKYTSVKNFPFWKVACGFPHHEWNQTQPFTMIAGQVYECENFRLLKSGCYTIQLQGSLF